MTSPRDHGFDDQAAERCSHRIYHQSAVIDGKDVFECHQCGGWFYANKTPVTGGDKRSLDSRDEWLAYLDTIREIGPDGKVTPVVGLNLPAVARPLVDENLDDDLEHDYIHESAQEAYDNERYHDHE